MSKTNPYNLPPPWNPGYAMPDNVLDEGLQRRAYTTAWAPRGSFDNPKVGTAGYAVPGYVKDEGYGVGAMVTRWAQRGTYAGPKVQHWLDKPSAKVVSTARMPNGAAALKIATMAGVEASIGNGHAPLTTYGLQSAKALIETVKMMPPAMRVAQLKKALGRIDPALYARAQADADKEAKLGVPADIALERGLAAAISYGLAAELVQLGKGKAVGKNTQVGGAKQLGMLGEDPTRAGYCWIPAAGSVPGHWERMRAGQTSCASAAPSGSGPVIRTGQGGGVTVTGSGGQVVTAPPVQAPASSPADKFLQLGPFMIPVSEGAWRDHRALAPEKMDYINQNIAIAASAGGVSLAEMKTGKYPFVRFQGDDGSAWGLFYQEKDGGTIIAYHKIAPEMMGDVLGIGGAIKDAAEWVGGAVASVFKAIWKGIKWVVAKVVDFVVDAAKWVASKTCSLVQTPGVAEGAQAVATAAPNPYTIGVAAGVTVTKMLCDKYGNEEGSPEAAAAAAADAAAAAAAAQKQKTMLIVGGFGVAAAIILFSGKKKS